MNYTSTRTTSQRTIVANVVQTGHDYVTQDRIWNAVEAGQKLAPLSAARTIKEDGWYWISAENVPTAAGYYRDNKDGTFTKVSDRSQVPLKDRLHVSEQAAAKAAAGAGPLVLWVGYDAVIIDSRLGVYSACWSDDVARVATVAQTQNQAGSVSSATNTIPKPIVKAARKEFELQIVKNPAIDASAFSSVRALLEAAERQ